jgi:hypothetical protein
MEVTKWLSLRVSYLGIGFWANGVAALVVFDRTTKRLSCPIPVYSDRPTLLPGGGRVRLMGTPHDMSVALEVLPKDRNEVFLGRHCDQDGLATNARSRCHARARRR